MIGDLKIKSKITDYYTCSVCGKYFCDADAQNEIEENSWVNLTFGAAVEEKVTEVTGIKRLIKYD